MDMDNSLQIEAFRLQVYNAIKKGLAIQTTSYYENGAVLYRGWTIRERPYGTGTVYWKNGKRYQEGLFGYKGLLQGAEYYPDGQIRFLGNFCANHGYGPNPPVCGSYYNENGTLRFKGQLVLHFGGVGHPTVAEPREYGSIRQHDAPAIRYYDCVMERS